MHSYQHNIKTFNNATRHLTRVERSLYRDAIELYYDTEQPLPAVDFDKLARRLVAHTQEERDALRYVLGEFFELTGDVYTHTYCDEVIEKFKSNSSAKARAGAASAEARKLKADARKQNRKTKKEQTSTGAEQVLNTDAAAVLNQKPETINQKPSNKDYFFEGVVIRLTEIDYGKAAAQYPNLDLSTELAQLDLELHGEKKWFQAMHAKLNYRNKNHANTQKPVNGFTDTRRLSGAERTRLAREQAFARQRDAAGAPDLGCVESN